MNLSDFEKATILARRSPAPHVDVEDAVLRRLAQQRTPVVENGEAARVWVSTFAYLAGAGAVAASVGAALFVQTWFSLTDPLAQVFNSFLVMIP